MTNKLKIKKYKETFFGITLTPHKKNYWHTTSFFLKADPYNKILKSQRKSKKIQKYFNVL
jgi:hypothetical protein